MFICFIFLVFDVSSSKIKWKPIQFQNLNHKYMNIKYPTFAVIVSFDECYSRTSFSAPFLHKSVVIGIIGDFALSVDCCAVCCNVRGRALVSHTGVWFESRGQSHALFNLLTTIQKYLEVIKSTVIRHSL